MLVFYLCFLYKITSYFLFLQNRYKVSKNNSYRMVTPILKQKELPYLFYCILESVVVESTCFQLRTIGINSC